MTRGWIVGEAWRDVASGTTHALRYTFALTAVLVTLVAADLGAVGASIDGAQEFQASGAATLTLQAVGAVDGAACDALVGVPGVTAAGALRDDPVPVVAAALPAAPIAAYSVSPGLMGVVGVSDDTGEAGAVLARDAADLLGVRAGGSLAVEDAQVPVRGTFAWPEDGRRRGFAHAVLSPTPTVEPFDECWVRAWPLTDETWGLAQLVVDRGAQPDVRVETAQLNSTRGTSFDGVGRFDDRVTRSAPLVALVVAGVLGYAAVRARRLELASARHVGVRAREQHAQLLLETLVWVLPAALLTVAATALLWQGRPAVGTAYALTGLVVLGGAAGALVGSQAATALARESHLFRDFKAR